MRFLVIATLCAVLSTAVMASTQKKTDYAKELTGFLEDVEKNYPFFEVKGIRKDWSKASKDLLARAKKAKDDVEFVRLVDEALRCLRDGHASFLEVRPKMPPGEAQFGPGVALAPAAGNRVTVLASSPDLAGRLPPGTVITKVDGKEARGAMEARGRSAWERGGYFSSPQRALFFEYRVPFLGPRGAKTTLHYLDGSVEKSIELRGDQEFKGWLHEYNLPEGLAQEGRSLWHGLLDGKFGYLYLRRMDEGIAEGLEAAIAAREVSGWVVDLRGNTGGGYSDALLTATRKLKKPVVAIIDAGCISAGETFARDLKREVEATIIGATSAGSSSQKRSFEFPSGVAKLQYSIKSRFGPDGRPIEWNGIRPDVEIEVDPLDVAAGRNTEIQAALRLLSR